MSKAVLISIQPKWCRLIESGQKTVEVRKSRPKMEPPFKCYIYQTCSGKVGTGLFLADGSEIMGKSVKNGTVIGEFVCNKFIPYCSARPILDAETVETQACLARKEVWEYCPAGNPIGWHISELVIYDKPKELSDFYKNGTLATKHFVRPFTTEREVMRIIFLPARCGSRLSHGATLKNCREV